MKLILAAGALAIVSMVPAAQAQDVGAGEKVFKKCLPCHAVGPDARNKVGPALNGLAGRTAGSVAGYNYSKANKESGIVWDEATFKEYIKDPRAMIKGTKMVFAGIKDDEDIANLWAFLAQFDAEGGRKK
jgi:cytochrome c